MKKLFAILLIVQGVLMSAVLDKVEINGIEVPLIFEEERLLPIASMQVVFRYSGSLADGEHPGLAKFSARMMNEGTKSLGATGFAKALEERAISLSAHAGTETFVFELGSLKEEFDQGTRLFAKLLKEPNLTQESFKKVQTTTIGSLMRKESDYDYQASLLLKRSLFEGTPLARPADGTVENLKALRLKDVEKFLKEHLVLRRAIVVVGGSMTMEEAKSYARKALEALPSGDVEPLPYFTASDKAETVVQTKPTEQAYIYFGAPFGLRVDDPESYKARVAAFILGSSGFGSRLMEEVRVKRGLAYSAYGRIALNKSSSYFSGYLQTKLESQEEAVKVVKEVIEEFVAKGATQQELDDAKMFLLGSEPLRNETLSQRLGRAFDEYYKGLGLGYFKKQLELIEALKLDDLNSFIKAHPEILKLTFAIITNENETENRK
ncbi:M16 family metallopeptidase [Hydrogenimonas urashimensis]|uniref:M16 family metallopeptidase n=1 Tax=Hydrogenimonas urashimensis TaxID=2740515 RepID=UPI001F2DD692|nr:pitrilysin family protein [Hydrogenimonas urashimensis]